MTILRTASGPCAVRILAACAAVILAGGAPAAAQTAGGAAAPPDLGAVVTRYCVACHNGRTLAGNLALDAIDTVDLAANAAVWEQVIVKLRAREMPPPRRPRPDAATYDALVAHLATTLDRAAATAPRPGRPGLHRLNRAEYRNVVRDLLGVEIDARALLPAENQAYGFDNIADLLTFSPGLLERYLSAARLISRMAVGDPTIRPDVYHHAVPASVRQDGRMSDDLPFGSQGGMAFRYQFPAAGEYALRVYLQSPSVLEGQPVDLRLDGELIADATLTTAEYEGERVATLPVAAEVRFATTAGPRLVTVAVARRAAAFESLLPARLPMELFTTGDNAVLSRATGIAAVEIEGPFDGVRDTGNAARRRLFVCEPASPADEAPCAYGILTALAERAYRRPVTGDDLEALLRFYGEGRAAGGFDAGIQRAVEALLVDPKFLFRVERDPVDVEPGTVYRLSDLELASRLSFFLWSSIPDDELRALAAGGRLSDPAVLDRQVRRMLADDRAAALVDNFAAQWLFLRNLRTIAPDRNRFPDFDGNLRTALEQELSLFVESQIREDRGLVELLTADYTFVNERLARHYGIPDVAGNHMRRVTLADAARRGLLGKGGILTVTSYADRTSPVIRGKWILENILGAPPPPPPPDVPALEENDGTEAPRTMRELLSKHRANPVCATCHSRIDPLGFAVEKFDAIGKWREADAGGPIDDSGVLPDGSAFEGVAELNRVLEARGDEFVTMLTGKLLTYAIGRGVDHHDMPAVRGIMRAAAPDYRWSSIIRGIVRSVPFQMRTAARRTEP